MFAIYFLCLVTKHLNLNKGLFYLFKLIIIIVLIQLGLLFLATVVNMLFNLKGIVYYMWSCWVFYHISFTFFHLPLNTNNIFSFISYRLLILSISGLIGYFIDWFVVCNVLHYQVNVGEVPNSSNNISGSGGEGGNNPQPPKDKLVVKNPDSHDSDKNKAKGIPQSTSVNSMNSEVSYTSGDLATAAQMDKQNFRNIVNNDTAKATDMYNEKADDLAKAKSELAKYKRTDRLLVGLKIEEEKPF